MPYLRDRVFVLRSEPFREQDIWLTCYGRTLGKCVAVARGTRQLHAKHLGHLEPLTEVDVMIAKGVAFDKIAVARLVAPRPHVRRNLSAAVLGGAAADFIDRLTHPGAPDPFLYELLQEVLDLFVEIEANVTPARGQFLFAVFCLKVLRMLGHVPDMDRCGHCRVTLKGEVFLLTSLGIIVCATCRESPLRSEVAGPLPRRSIPLFLFVSAQPLQDCLKLTASHDLLEAVQEMTLASLSHTSIRALPHGFESVWRTLDSLQTTEDTQPSHIDRVDGS